MQRVIVSAMSVDRVIGCGDGMPWDVPEEYAHYLALVRGATLVMGRRSWEIFGQDSTAEQAIVVTSRPHVEGAVVASSLEAALARAVGYGRTCFIAGGGQVYAEALEKGLVDTMCLSIITGSFTGDTYFPSYDAADWELVEARDEAKYRYMRLDRRH